MADPRLVSARPIDDDLGFDQSLRDTLSSLGPDTITVAKFSGVKQTLNGAELAKDIVCIIVTWIQDTIL